MEPVVPLLDRDADQRGHLDAAGAEGSTLYRALANQPALLRAWVDFAWTLRNALRVPHDGVAR